METLTPQDYEIAMFAQATWRLARSSDQNELIAVACVLRNHIMPRLGQVATYRSYMECIVDFFKVYPTRELPSLTDPAFVSAPEGLLFNIAGIYNCETPDITATHDHPNGAKYFNRVSQLEPSDWFVLEITNKQGQHPLIGTFGSMQFFQ